MSSPFPSTGTGGSAVSGEVKDGGPAFPHTPIYSGDDRDTDYDGMTLRDWFAGQALAGIAGTLTELTSRDNSENSGGLLLEGIEGSGALAYALADAMIAARSK